MEAFVRLENRRRFLEKRFDYLALVPAAAAICYPFLLNAFHAIVGTQAVSPPPALPDRHRPLSGMASERRSA